MSRSRRWDEVVARRGHDLRATQARPRQPPRRWREGVGEVLRLPMQEGRRGACGRRQSAGMVKEVEVVEMEAAVVELTERLGVRTEVAEEDCCGRWSMGRPKRMGRTKNSAQNACTAVLLCLAKKLVPYWLVKET